MFRKSGSSRIAEALGKFSKIVADLRAGADANHRDIATAEAEMAKLEADVRLLYAEADRALSAATRIELLINIED